MESYIKTDAGTRQIINTQDKEARKEVRRIAEEKKLGLMARFIFSIYAFFLAAKCTNNYIVAVREESVKPDCNCGYHTSRRLTNLHITKKTAGVDLKNIADRFGITNAENETKRSAKILLEILDTTRKELKQPRLLRESYLDSAVRSEILPEFALDVLKYLRAGEMSVRQADNAPDRNQRTLPGAVPQNGNQHVGQPGTYPNLIQKEQKYDR